MAVKKYKPVTPGTRGMTGHSFEEITKSKPERSLLVPLRKSGGRNSYGRVTVRHRGGGHRRFVRLVDFKLEFGRLYENDEMRIVLADEISPDNCRLWDAKTGEKMDKDRFRRDLGKVEEGYQEVAKRLGILPEAGMRDMKGPETVQ